MRISRISLVLSTAFFAACSTTSENRPVRPMRPPTTADMEYHEAVDLGSRYVMDYGYSDTEFQGAERITPNIWQVHYGLSADNHLELYFDGTKKTLVKAEELKGISGSWVPEGLAPQTVPSDVPLKR
jgi:hypothetical protein